jgi:hypothetical protein
MPHVQCNPLKKIAFLARLAHYIVFSLKWQKTCVDVGFFHQTLKTPMKTKFVNKVIFFQETFEYYDAINLFYQKQETQELQGHVLNANT